MGLLSISMHRSVIISFLSRLLCSRRGRKGTRRNDDKEELSSVILVCRCLHSFKLYQDQTSGIAASYAAVRDSSNSIVDLCGIAQPPPDAGKDGPARRQSKICMRRFERHHLQPL